jgi:hypothetical protein
VLTVSSTKGACFDMVIFLKSKGPEGGPDGAGEKRVVRRPA